MSLLSYNVEYLSTRQRSRHQSEVQRLQRSQKATNSFHCSCANGRLQEVETWPPTGCLPLERQQMMREMEALLPAITMLMTAGMKGLKMAMAMMGP